MPSHFSGKSLPFKARSGFCPALHRFRSQQRTGLLVNASRQKRKYAHGKARAAFWLGETDGDNCARLWHLIELSYQFDLIMIDTQDVGLQGIILLSLSPIPMLLIHRAKGSEQLRTSCEKRCPLFVVWQIRVNPAQLFTLASSRIRRGASLGKNQSCSQLEDEYLKESKFCLTDCL